MLEQTDNTVLRISLDSVEASIAKVEPLVRDLASRYELSEDRFSNILISLTEAVHNAIIHGNKLDENKKVVIELRCVPQALKIAVSDEGEGFDPSALANPIADENLECCGGRGVFIIQHLADRCDFLNDGRTVNLQFNI